ncbi:hypothetical protein I7I51_05690 [Histoplasma capsulatum]|uniref:Uncharacterized protein n=1 Tax=Ajellomyces capsulatus TaxID=5037 RepID=A0A8A1M5G2_AJECA|nr:hypothetical protein I7I51_05690 [Histoplasma capsulatum]
MEDGGWRMEDGGWRMGDGGWEASEIKRMEVEVRFEVEQGEASEQSTYSVRIGIFAYSTTQYYAVSPACTPASACVRPSFHGGMVDAAEDCSHDVVLRRNAVTPTVGYSCQAGPRYALTAYAGFKLDLKYLFSSDLFAAHPSLPVRIILPDWEPEDGPMKALGLGTITNDFQFSEVTGTNRKRIHRVLFPPLSGFARLDS